MVCLDLEACSGAAEMRPVLARPRALEVRGVVAAGEKRFADVAKPTGCLLCPRDARVDRIGLAAVRGVEAR